MNSMKAKRKTPDASTVQKTADPTGIGSFRFVSGAICSITAVARRIRLKLAI